jgi:hypothetical protein
MDSGFFRLLDAGRYMELDGITAKHLYRFLAVAFEKTEVVVIDSRKLATEHLGILTPPQYFSRLMQTLEPAFEQLTRIQVLGSYHIVDADQWRIALHRHAAYVPERKSLALNGTVVSSDDSWAWIRVQLEKAGIPSRAAADYCEAFGGRADRYQIQRAARLLEEMKVAEVAHHVAVAAIRQALDAGPGDASTNGLDWCEIALEVCRQKRRSGQAMRNLPGLLVKIARDPESRDRLVDSRAAEQFAARFRQREQAAFRHQDQQEERELVLEYERVRQQLAATILQDLPESTRQAMRREKLDMLKNDERFEKLPPDLRAQELDELILQQIARKEVPTFEKWLLRKRAHQAVLPFLDPGDGLQEVSAEQRC